MEIEVIYRPANRLADCLSRYAEKHGLRILYRHRRFYDDVIVLSENGEMKHKILKYFHEDRLVGAHLGIEKTHAKIERRFIRNDMRRDIRRYISNCDNCQRRKIIPMEVKKEELAKYEVPTGPFERIHVDLLGPLKQTLDANRFCLVTVCAFSKYAIVTPIPDQRAETIAKGLVQDVITKHGTPRTLVSDRGSQFISEIYEASCRILGVDHFRTAAYHHQGNGQEERMYLTLEQMISQYINKKLDNWDEHICFVSFAYNSSKNSTTGFTPFFLVHGREARTPIDATLPKPTYAEELRYDQRLMEDLAAARKIVTKNIGDRTEERKRRYDEQKNVQSREFKIGDKVLIRNETAGKFENQFVGPFDIVMIQKPNVSVRLQKGYEIIHLDRVKKYRTSNYNQHSSDDDEDNEAIHDKKKEKVDTKQ